MIFLPTEMTQEEFTQHYIECDEEFNAAIEEFRNALNKFEKAHRVAHSTMRELMFYAEKYNKIDRVWISRCSIQYSKHEAAIARFNGLRCEMLHI